MAGPRSLRLRWPNIAGSIRWNSCYAALSAVECACGVAIDLDVRHAKVVNVIGYDEGQRDSPSPVLRASEAWGKGGSIRIMDTRKTWTCQSNVLILKLPLIGTS